jgi:hypothetical protein
VIKSGSIFSSTSISRLQRSDVLESFSSAMAQAFTFRAFGAGERSYRETKARLSFQ